jgi:hypothetical protein
MNAVPRLRQQARGVAPDAPRPDDCDVHFASILPLDGV